MTTIRRNWTKRATAIQEAAKHCRAYDSSTGHMATVDPARAFEAWRANPRASLREETPGRKWVVHVHSNKFYVLTAADPEQDRQERQRKATTAPAPAPTTPAAPVRSSAEEAVLDEVRDYIKDAPGIGAHTVTAASAVLGQKVESGVLRRDRLTGALPGIAAAVTTKAVADMRAQGLAHEQIRQRLERKKAEGQHSGNVARVTVADTMIAAHAGLMADEARKTAAAITARAPELESGAKEAAALTAPAPVTAEKEPAATDAAPSAPRTHAGIPVPSRVREAWGGPLGEGWRLGVMSSRAAR